MNTHTQSKQNLIEHLKLSRYFSADGWADYNRQFFDGLAKKYDATNILHSFGQKARLDQQFIDRVPISPNARILDLCTGTGDIALLLAKQYPSAQITALDASEEMLGIARQKSSDKQLHNIDFVAGDVLNLPFADESFDVVLISFGLRNLADMDAGLRQMRRVTRHGGYIANIDQGKPSSLFAKLLYRVYFYNIAPLLGKLVFHLGEFNSFRYLPESNKFFPSPAELVQLYSELGLRNIQNYDYMLGAVAQQVMQR